MLFRSAPHIRVGGEPLFLVNILERKFVLFGFIMWPQDTYLLGIAMVSFVVFLILFTVVYGRVWCGWACPQTLFMEIIFRRIEAWIDGSPSQQKALRERPMDFSKFIRRLFKFLVFLIVIFFTVNTFASYFTGKEGLFLAYSRGFSGHPYLLAFLLLFTFIGMFVYGWFREQTCSVICPYGRLQGVLLDNDTVLVAYDYRRGEPRGKGGTPSSRKESGLGHCIDCHQCIQVCPAGIDVRNGTQLECINCCACADACDHVMDKAGLPKGLIRLTSEKSIQLGTPHRFSARAIAYSLVLTALIGFLVFLIAGRSSVEATILRTPGMLWQPYDSTHISNLYNIRLVNKTRTDQAIHIEAHGIDARVLIAGGDSLAVKAKSSTEAVFFLILPSRMAISAKQEILFRVYANGKKVQDFSTTFVGTKPAGQ